MLSADDDLPFRPHRILVAGISGSGKSTLCRRIAEATGIPYTELDSLHHGPDRTPQPDFAQTVERITAAPDWVSEWRYRPVRQLLLQRADLLVWLDPPFRVALAQVLGRTVRRRSRRQALQNAGLEPPPRALRGRRTAVRGGSIRPRISYRAQLSALQDQADAPVVVRLRSRRQSARWVSGPLQRAMQEG